MYNIREATMDTGPEVVLLLLLLPYSASRAHAQKVVREADEWIRRAGSRLAWKKQQDSTH
jgi:hypothetical protein